MIENNETLRDMLAIGVTGHRFLVEVDKITAGVDDALRQIKEAFPASQWTVISPLAEGADRLVVHRILARSRERLIVPLLLAGSGYMADFESAESREEFEMLLALADEVITLVPASTRDQAYAAAGRYVLDHCEVLIAIWDGQGAQGQGGTGEIVAEARQRGLPIAWIHAGSRRMGMEEPTTLVEEQGQVSLERFPNQAVE